LPRQSEALLICQSYGIEYMRSHRALQLLAERLASAGFYVLRFDYYGTGDSAGETTDAGIDDWFDNIGAAAEELRQRSGLQKISVLGHRLGALLVSADQERCRDFERVVLWDPPETGAAWLNQQERIKLEAHRMWNAQRPRSSRTQPPPACEMFGYEVSPAWREQLAALQFRRPAAATVALSKDEAAARTAEALLLPDSGHWRRLDWVTRPWNPRASVALVAAHLGSPSP
jgi:pimeloyl-ACP methyl ester carboxylesterase